MIKINFSIMYNNFSIMYNIHHKNYNNQFFMEHFLKHIETDIVLIVSSAI